MTEVFLVNIKMMGDDKFKCFRATHSLASATEMAKGAREAGHEVNVQSVLMDDNGKVSID